MNVFTKTSPLVTVWFPRFLVGVQLGLLLWIAFWGLGIWSIIPAFNLLGVCITIGTVALAWLIPATRRLLFVVCGATIVVLAVVAATPVTGELVPSLIRRDRVSIDSADAIVVLGSSATGPGLLDQEGIDRFLTGLRLVREGKARVIVSSRPAYSLRNGSRPDPDWARLMALLPVQPRLEVLDSTETTRAEALRFSRLANAYKWRRIFVVTSPLHTRRACATFEKIGVAVICVPSESRDLVLPNPEIPLDRLKVFAMWLHEAVGWEVYRLRGWT